MRTRLVTAHRAPTVSTSPRATCRRVCAAGATLHFDSDPAQEEQETGLKASALLAALEQAAQPGVQPMAVERVELVARLPVLLIDHRDSFVHTLADYLRQAGCAVSTLRSGIMAVAHRQRPWWAMQFHPESILSADQHHGLRMIRNLVDLVSRRSP